ncbi:hypothetical protein AB0M50_00465 [Nonomuraea fuscirosea]|jgi:hypothetical protein|uniref:hypothetical protein n=1 Tax=Nonomuraea fuscirosea TaxID=1291556 RepID=UPI003449F284
MFIVEIPSFGACFGSGATFRKGRAPEMKAPSGSIDSLIGAGEETARPGSSTRGTAFHPIIRSAPRQAPDARSATRVALRAPGECLIAYVLDVEDVMMGGWL